MEFPDPSAPNLTPQDEKGTGRYRDIRDPLIFFVDVDVELFANVDTVEELTNILPLDGGRLLDASGCKIFMCGNTRGVQGAEAMIKREEGCGDVCEASELKEVMR